MPKTPERELVFLAVCAGAMMSAVGSVAGCGRSTAANLPQTAAAPVAAPQREIEPPAASPEPSPAILRAALPGGAIDTERVEEPGKDHGKDRGKGEPAESPEVEPARSPAAATPKPSPSASANPASPKPDSPKPASPPADRMPARPGEAEKLTFDDLNLGMQADIVFRPFMLTDRVNELAGKRVSIIGYMHGGVASQRGIKEFILLKNTQCKFGPGGQADHLASVTLKSGQTTSLTTSPIKVEGTLRIEPFQGPDGNTWSIFRLEDALLH